MKYPGAANAFNLEIVPVNSLEKKKTHDFEKNDKLRM